MTLGEIKVEALRCMGVNLAEDIRAELMEELITDENYKSYLVNMVGPINRCLSLFERRGLWVPERKEGAVSRITMATGDDFDLGTMGVPDALAELIPLFIKSELFATDDEGLAAAALSQFERAVREFEGSFWGRARQTAVADVMGGFK